MLNTVLHGDCLELMKDIPDGSVDMILCDLPYGTTACKWDTIIPFEPLWDQYNRIIKDNGAIVLFGNEPFSSALRMSNIKNYKYDWTWKKNRVTGQGFAKYQPMRTIENIIVFSSGGKTHYFPQMTERSENELKRLSKKESIKTKPSEAYTMKYSMSPNRTKNRFKYPFNLLEFKSERSPKHPTQKPVALFEYLIKTYTNEGETVLDNCAGSGTTGIAAINTNRNYILMEQEQEYIDVINKRIEEHTQTVSIF